MHEKSFGLALRSIVSSIVEGRGGEEVFETLVIAVGGIPLLSSSSIHCSCIEDDEEEREPLFEFDFDGTEF